MNRIFRPMGNDKRCNLAVASGNARLNRKKSWCDSTALAGDARLVIFGLAGSLALATGSSAQMLPTGGMVSAGAASISSSASKLTVTQSSQNAAINWQSFSIGSGEAVQFVQPNANSVALNRVVGSDPSSILGSLSANGRVFLANPNGVLFGKGAQVNVGGLVASTLNITDANFMAGEYRFSGTGGAVLNQGSITADGGYVALLGANVSNQGVISAKLGAVVLAAGAAMTLDLAGDGRLKVAVDQSAVNALVQNGGVIRADGGQVTMTASAAGQLLRTVVNNTGVIEAQSVGDRDGLITLVGDPNNGIVEVSGTLNASGLGAGQTGGSITITGNEVGLFGGQLIAAGDTGGGTVLVGGGLHGANPALQNASATYMSAGSTIDADAITSGNGGQVALWSANSTRAYGSISARGGAQGGDGGLIETSGHSLDVVGVTVHTNAPHGKGGDWLLDPADVTIGAGTTNGTLSSGGVFAPNAGVGAATVDANAIQVALNGGSDVTINTTNAGGVPGPSLGDITVNSALTWTTGNTLTLNADHDITVSPGAAITASTQNAKIVLTAGNNLNVQDALTASQQSTQILLTAGNDILATGAGAVTATGLNAKVDMGAGHDVSVVAVTADGGGSGTSINLHANHDVLVNGSLSAAGGAIALIADQDGTGPGVGGGTVSFVSPGVVAASATTEIRFNPNGYANTTTEIANYTAKVTGTLDARAWVFPLGTNKAYDGTTADTLQFKNPTPADNPNVGNSVTLNGGSATFDTKDVGVLKVVTFNGYTLGGGDAAKFAIFSLQGVTPGNGTTTADITPVPLTVTANDHAPKLYGATVTFAGTEYTSIGLVNSETIGGVTLTSAGAAPAAPVGSYAITPSNALANGAFAPSNYVITYVNGTLPVTPAPLIVTANDASKTYGEAITLPDTAFTSSGLVNGETIGGVTETSAGAPATAAVVGSPYAITPSNATGGTFSLANYTVTYVNGALTVTPAPLIVTANDASKTNGTAITLPDTAFTSSGLVNGETIGGVTETSAGAAATAAVVGSPYAITPSNATGGTFSLANYTTTYVNGALTVLPVVTPPVVTPPVVTPPVVTPPVVTPPVTGAGGSTPLPTTSGGPTSGEEESAIAISPYGPLPIVGAPLGMQLAVVGGGVRMPVYAAPEAQPAQSAPAVGTQQVAPVETQPAQPAPKPYVAPVHPRRPGRN